MPGGPAEVLGRKAVGFPLKKAGVRLAPLEVSQSVALLAVSGSTLGERTHLAVKRVGLFQGVDAMTSVFQRAFRSIGLDLGNVGEFLEKTGEKVYARTSHVRTVLVERFREHGLTVMFKGVTGFSIDDFTREGKDSVALLNTLGIAHDPALSSADAVQMLQTFLRTKALLANAAVADAIRRSPQSAEIVQRIQTATDETSAMVEYTSELLCMLFPVQCPMPRNLRQVASIMTMSDKTCMFTRGMERALKYAYGILGEARYAQLVDEIATHETMELIELNRLIAAGVPVLDAERKAHEYAMAHAGTLQAAFSRMVGDMNDLLFLETHVREGRVHLDREHIEAMWGHVENLRKGFLGMTHKSIPFSTLLSFAPTLRTAYMEMLDSGTSPEYEEMIISVKDISGDNVRAHLMRCGAFDETGRLRPKTRVIVVQDLANPRDTAQMEHAAQEIERIAHEAPQGSSLVWALGTEMLKVANEDGPAGNSVRRLLQNHIAQPAVVESDGKLLSSSGYVSETAMAEIARLHKKTIAQLEENDIRDTLEMVALFRAEMVSALGSGIVTACSTRLDISDAADVDARKAEFAKMVAALERPEVVTRYGDETIVKLLSLGWMLYDTTHGMIGRTDEAGYTAVVQAHSNIAQRALGVVSTTLTAETLQWITHVHAEGPVTLHRRKTLANGMVIIETLTRGPDGTEKQEGFSHIVAKPVLELERLDMETRAVMRIQGLVRMVIGLTLVDAVGVNPLVELLFKTTHDKLQQAEKYKALAAAA